MNSPARLTAVIFLGLFTVLFLVFVFSPIWYDQINAHLASFYESLFMAKPSNVNRLLSRWFLFAVLTNSISVLCAMILILKKKERALGEIVFATFLGILIGFHLISLLLIYTSQFDFNVVVIFTVLVFIVSDIYGVIKTPADRPDHALYKYPLWCLDVPTAAILIVLLVFEIKGVNPSQDFYHGAGSAVMMLSGASYIGLMAFVVPDQKRRTP